jgi:hypothetical protein
MWLEGYLDVQASNVIRVRGHRIGLEHVVDALFQSGTESSTHAPETWSWYSSKSCWSAHSTR